MAFDKSEGPPIIVSALKKVRHPPQEVRLSVHIVPTTCPVQGFGLKYSHSVFFKVVPQESKWNEYDNTNPLPGMFFVPNALVDGPQPANWRNQAVNDKKRKEDSILHENRRFEADH